MSSSIGGQHGFAATAAVVSTCWALAACGTANGGSDGVDAVPGPDAAGAATDDGGADAAFIDPACVAPADVSASPNSIEDVVALVNALKAQQTDALTLPCFLQSLSRPMGALATRSVFSAQPANGSKNPRFFLFTGALVMSVVPAGEGRPLLELAAYSSETRSIKGEIHFPVEAPLAPTAPYERIIYGETTTCGACHANQEMVGNIDGISRYESDVLRPRNSELVTLEFVRNQSDTCAPEVDPDRCAMLWALFAHGELTAGAFSASARTIYGGF